MQAKSGSAMEQPDYLSYLLRLWWVGDDDGTQPGEADSPGLADGVWRASLESPQAGERKGFASLDDLFDFLREETSTLRGA
jgi:hypothetical protein